MEGPGPSDRETADLTANCELRTAQQRNPLKLSLDLERYHDAEERCALYERGQNESGGLNTTGCLRLPSHSFHSLAANTPNSKSRANYGEAGAQSRANQCQAVAVRTLNGGLQH